MTEPLDPELASRLVEAFVLLSQGDFTVRLARNYSRDSADTLAFLVNTLAEEMAQVFEARERDRREMTEGIARLSEVFAQHASGNFSVRAERTHSGDPLDVLASLVNNTALEVGNLFAELEQQMNLVEAILDMTDGVILLDAEGKIRNTNLAITRLLGYEPGSLVGKPVGELLDAAQALPEPGLEFQTRDLVFRTATSETLSLSVTASRQGVPGGERSGTVWVARDDRPLKRAQAQLQMADRLSALGTVAAGVAHEINNPLTYVLANLDHVLGETQDGRPFDAEARVALQQAREGADRVRQIVRVLKTFSRVDEERTEAVDVAKLLDASVAMIRNEVLHRAQLLKAYGPAPLVQVNSARLGQVFLNLVHNAAQAIPEGNVEGNHVRLVIGTDEKGWCFVEVHDTGCGIPKENLGRIYDAFFTTKPIGEGTGLGLSLCQKIVQSCGGRIDVRSTVGVGTVFTVSLPPAPEQVVAPRRPSQPVAGAKRYRILVIDDEPMIGRAAARALSKDHDVDVATSSKEALAQIERKAYDAMLCDLMMPDMTGMDLHEQLERERPELAAKMVFMTGGAFTARARAFLDRVPNARVEKPFNNTDLRELLNSVLHAGA